MDTRKEIEQEGTGGNGPTKRPHNLPGGIPPPLPPRPPMATETGVVRHVNGTRTPATEMPPPLPPRVNAGAELKIVIDTREQTPLAFPEGVPTVRGTLHTGDYSIAGHESRFTVERKSLADLVQTVIHNRARFERELARMGPFDFRRVIVTAPFGKVARGKYPHSKANPRSVIASICAFEIRYKVPFVFAANEQEATARVIDWARHYMREETIRTHREMLAAAERKRKGGG